VVWLRDAADDHVLVAYDWDGHRTGSLRVRASEPFGVVQSPDGAALVLLHGRPVDGGTVVGRARGNVTWARDDAHLCAFRTDSGNVYVPTMYPATPPAPSNEFIGYGAGGVLFLDDPSAGTSRRIESFGAFGDHGGPVVLSCSVPDDRAVVGDSFVAHLSDVHALTLSTGRRAGATHFADTGPDSPGGVVVSPDGRLVAVGSTSSMWNASPQCEIRDAASGALLSTLTGGADTFSDDDSRVLTVTYLGNSNQRALYRLVDWRSGRTVWSAEMPPATVIRRPHSGDVLLLSSEWHPVPGSTRNQPVLASATIVRGDGTTSRLDAAVLPIQ
jgi:hypothetical protein